MIDIDKVIKEVSKRTGIDIQIVDAVCKHPFKFTVDVMKDDTDNHDILFNGLYRFKLKGRFKNNKNKQYSPYEKDNKEY